MKKLFKSLDFKTKWMLIRYASGIIMVLILNALLGDSAETIYGFCIVMAIALCWSFLIPWPDYK